MTWERTAPPYCTPVVIVLKPQALAAACRTHGTERIRALTVIFSDRAGFHGVFKLPTRHPEAK